MAMGGKGSIAAPNTCAENDTVDRSLVLQNKCFDRLSLTDLLLCLLEMTAHAVRHFLQFESALA